MDIIRRRKSTIFMLVFPGLLIFSFAVLFPIVKSLFYGMTDWKGIGEYNFVGAENFKKVVLDDKVFRTSLLNAAILAASTVIIQHPIAMFLQ